MLSLNLVPQSFIKMRRGLIQGLVSWNKDPEWLWVKPISMQSLKGLYLHNPQRRQLGKEDIISFVGLPVFYSGFAHTPHLGPACNFLPYFMMLSISKFATLLVFAFWTYLHPLYSRYVTPLLFFLLWRNFFFLEHISLSSFLSFFFFFKLGDHMWIWDSNIGWQDAR